MSCWCALEEKYVRMKKKKKGGGEEREREIGKQPVLQ